MIGKKHSHYTSLSSTHTEAVRLLASGSPPHGQVISADYQRAGRGQRGNSWLSQPGLNVLLSVILFPQDIDANAVFKLHMFSSLAVIQLLRKLGLENARIKWPNDILVDGKKIAGLLVYNQFQGSAIKGSVVSIGLNVNQHKFGKLDKLATSALQATGRTWEVEFVRGQLMIFLDEQYSQLQIHPERTRMAYFNLLDGTQTEVQFAVRGGDTKSGFIENIYYDGRITVRTAGRKETYSMNDLKIFYE